MTKAEIAGSKIYMAMRKMPEAMVPLIIGHLLRMYKRYGLADIVEAAWNWRKQDE
jgi:hypothetical protein